MIVVSAHSNNPMYVAGAKRLEESCKAVGVEPRIRHLDILVPSDRNIEILRQCYTGMVEQMRDVLMEADCPVMLVGADDEITFNPALALPESGPDIGLMRNPEIDSLGAHLRHAAQWVAWPTDTAKAFLNLILDTMNRYQLNDHRALCACAVMWRGFTKELDITPNLYGCVKRIPSNFKPEWEKEFKDAIQKENK
jgi:hypothetical protein